MTIIDEMVANLPHGRIAGLLTVVQYLNANHKCANRGNNMAAGVFDKWQQSYHTSDSVTTGISVLYMQ